MEPESNPSKFGGQDPRDVDHIRKRQKYTQDLEPAFLAAEEPQSGAGERDIIQDLLDQPLPASLPQNSTLTDRSSSNDLLRCRVELGNNTYTLISEVSRPLRGFEKIRHPRRFCKRGRVVAIVHVAPAGSPEDECTFYIKIRRFIIIRQGAEHCLALPIHTYRGQATTKTGIDPESHCALIQAGREVQLHDGETLANKPIEIKLEDPNATLDPNSRVAFSKVHTIQHNVPMRNVGRLLADSLRLLEEYFMKSLEL